MRTGGRKPAFGAQHRRDNPLINFYQCNKGKAKYLKQYFHEQWLSAFQLYEPAFL